MFFMDFFPIAIGTGWILAQNEKGLEVFQAFFIFSLSFKVAPYFGALSVSWT